MDIPNFIDQVGSLTLQISEVCFSHEICWIMYLAVSIIYTPVRVQGSHGSLHHISIRSKATKSVQFIQFCWYSVFTHSHHSPLVSESHFIHLYTIDYAIACDADFTEVIDSAFPLAWPGNWAIFNATAACSPGFVHSHREHHKVCSASVGIDFPRCAIYGPTWYLLNAKKTNTIVVSDIADVSRSLWPDASHRSRSMPSWLANFDSQTFHLG